jgi:hypothetical protein
MAKTTATVTVGADTSPFERKMRTLGKGLTGGITAGVSGIGNAAMSTLGTGLGIGLGFLGINSLPAIFDKLRAVSPQLSSAFTQLKVSVSDALIPAANKLAEVLNDNMPAIESGLSMFGEMLADAIQFWTEDAFKPEIWKDIGEAIADSVRDVLIGDGSSQTAGLLNLPASGIEAEARRQEDAIDAWLIRANPFNQMLMGNFLWNREVIPERASSL